MNDKITVKKAVIWAPKSVRVPLCGTGKAEKSNTELTAVRLSCENSVSAGSMPQGKRSTENSLSVPKWSMCSGLSKEFSSIKKCDTEVCENRPLN